MKDWCTFFPEYWVQWTSPLTWKVCYIGDICKAHDIAPDVPYCDNKTFGEMLWEERIVGSFLIYLIGSSACWVRYPINMYKRMNNEYSNE